MAIPQSIKIADRIHRSPPSLLGIMFGGAVWLVSYQGWVPAPQIMAPPSRDRTGRPLALLAAHLVYGAVIGVIIGAHPSARK